MITIILVHCVIWDLKLHIKVSPLVLVANLKQQRNKKPNAFLKVNTWWNKSYLESIAGFAPSLAWMLELQFWLPKLEPALSDNTSQETMRSMQYHLYTLFNRSTWYWNTWNNNITYRKTKNSLH